MQQQSHCTDTGNTSETSYIVAKVEIESGDWKVTMDHPYTPNITATPQVPTTYFVYVEDVDDAYQSALARGAISLAKPADRPHHERSAKVRDLMGNTWRFYSFKKQLHNFALTGGLV